MQNGENQNRLVIDQKKSAVRKMAQPDAANVFKADGKVQRILRGGKHGVPRLIHKSRGHGGIALMIPEGGFFHIGINERML